jgi:hypothetical protein
MDLDFKSDGTVETLNIEANVNFLNNLGELKTFGTSKTETLRLSEHEDAIVDLIYDSEGHICNLCFKKCNYFIEPINDQIYIMICNKCIEKIHRAFTDVSKTTLS